MSARYVGRAAFKAAMGITDTDDDAQIDAVLESVSRQVDQWTNRQYQPVVQTRYYAPRSAVSLLVDDLLAVTALATDEDGDRVYETSWAATDYDLEPVNARLESPPRPYTRLEVSPDGDYLFPSIARGVRIAGTWGYYDVRTTVSVALAEALDASETGVDVASGAAFDVGQTILIDSEQMEITAISSNTLTVRRGVNGTTAATHNSGLSVDIYTYPVIERAVLIQSSRIFRRKDAPFGTVGSPEFGVLRLLARLDPDVQQLLWPFKRWSVG